MTPEQALAHWNRPGPPRPAPDAGLINRTWWVGAGEPPSAVLQWVNPIFDPTIHLDVAAVTERLEARGVPAPSLLPTRRGDLWLADDPGCWRLSTYLPGRTLHRLEGPAHAAEAGAFVGRFHAALSGWNYEFQAPRREIHDTPARMAELETALTEETDHPLATAAGAVGAEILDRWQSWDGELDLPRRPCHGDLKVSNLRFDDESRAVGVLDLDTVGPQALACEMGDAWRSWCNPAGEDDPEKAHLDLDLFTAAARAWLAQAPPLEPVERRSLVPGIERICLELAARFCADALRNSYFRENRQRHPSPGAHNLLRARGQLALARSARELRGECEAVVGSG